MIILDMKKPSSCETCPLHWNEQGMMCCGVTHDVVRENCPIKAEIPDNATNGDVMKAVFNCKTSNEDSDYLVKYSLDGIYEEVSSDWWNAPYKAESED